MFRFFSDELNRVNFFIVTESFSNSWLFKNKKKIYKARWYKISCKRVVFKVDTELWIIKKKTRSSNCIHDSFQIYKYIKLKYSESSTDMSRLKIKNQYMQRCESWMNQKHWINVRVNVACDYTMSFFKNEFKNLLSTNILIRRLKKKFFNWKTRIKAWTFQKHFRLIFFIVIRWKFKRQSLLFICRQQK